MSLRRLALLSILVALILGCFIEHATEPVAGGGSSETTNGVVTGSVLNSDGSSAIGARVIIRSRGYLKDTLAALAKLNIQADEALTDAHGLFALDSVKPGDYLLEVMGQTGQGAIKDFSAGDRDTIALSLISLKPTGSVTGNIASEISGKPTVYVQIYGLDRVTKVDSVTGNFLFTDLPEGSYTLKATVTSDLVDPREVSCVASTSADTNDIGNLGIASFGGEDYATWPYVRTLGLNTTSSGAGIKNHVANFPVLVRLHAGNFDFTQSNAKDIRFADKQGKKLRYEIESWDSLKQVAAIWVKVDTIHADTRTDFITMHWGKPKALDWSEGRQVFDTSDGYAGVWHLKESALDTSIRGLYKDATPSAHNGDDRIQANDKAGIIGDGQRFNLGDYIKAQPSYSLRPSKQIMISTWFRGTATGKAGSTIASLGDSYGLRVDTNGNIHLFIPKTKNSWNSYTTQDVNVLDSAWHQIVGIYTGTALQIFVDGAYKGASLSSAPINYVLGPDFYIGRHGTSKREYDFVGSLDEVTVLNRAPSADWVKLSFESQRINPTLLEFR